MHRRPSRPLATARTQASLFGQVEDDAPFQCLLGLFRGVAAPRPMAAARVPSSSLDSVSILSKQEQEQEQEQKQKHFLGYLSWVGQVAPPQPSLYRGYLHEHARVATAEAIAIMIVKMRSGLSSC